MSTNLVKYGFWADFNRSPAIDRYQILMSNYYSGIFTNATAVLITSTSGPIFNLTIAPLNWLSKKISSLWNNAPAGSLEDARDFQEAFDIMLENLPRGFVNIPLNVPAAPNGTRGAAEVLRVLVVTLIAFGFPTALLIASIMSTSLATDSTALSASSLCGRYVYSPENTKYSGPFLEYEHRAEAQAGLYASDCYGITSLVDTCNKFYSQSLPYYTVNATCPLDGEACLGSGNTSISFSTGLLPASILGINIARPLLFSRITTCSPLATGDAYIKKGASSVTGEEQWEYWYGASLADYTWANPVRQSAWEIKGYSTGIHCSEPSSPDSPFLPLPEFTAGPYPVTMIFISSHTIMYSERRDDPIFPALTEDHLPPGYRGPKLYKNNSTRAGVLGCADQYQICDSESGPCWDNGNITSLLEGIPEQNVRDEQLVVILLLLALDYSTSCGSIQFQGAEALDAQSKIAHMQSLPLAKDQWRVEAEKMFQTSLARMQLNVFDLARGTAASFDGYKDTLPEQYRGICGMVKIPTIGWTNVNFCGSLGTVLGVTFIWLIGWKRKNAQGDKVLVADTVWKSVIVPVFLVLNRYLQPVFGKAAHALQYFIMEPLIEFLLRII